MQTRPSVADYSVDEHLKSLDLTEKEARKMQEAFKNPEFLKLFEQYAADISSQEAKEEQDAYLRQIEEAGNSEEIFGKDIELIVPTEHFVVKTRTRDGTKVFVNVCSSHKVQAAFSSTKTNPATKRPGVAWDIPFIMGKLGDSKDKQGAKCIVVDFIVNEETVETARACDGFCSIMIETAMDHLKSNHGLSLVGKGLRIRSKYKAKQGSTRPSVVAIKKKQDLNEPENTVHRAQNVTSSADLQAEQPNTVEEAKYTLVYLHDADLSAAWNDSGRGLHDFHPCKPKAIRINVDMNGVDSRQIPLMGIMT